MEDFLQLIVKCFPIATFILVVSSCTSRPKEPKTVPARTLTLSESSISVGDENEETEKSVEVTETERTETEGPSMTEMIPEVRSVACGNKKEPKDKSEESPDNNSAPKKKEEPKAEQDIVLDESNPHFAFFLQENNRDLAQCCLHARVVLEQTAAFQWTMKKRLSFDEGCWKHFNRRTSGLAAEGFDVRVNTRQARENKTGAASRESNLDKIFAKMSNAKPKKKAAE